MKNNNANAQVSPSLKMAILFVFIITIILVGAYGSFRFIADHLITRAQEELHGLAKLREEMLKNLMSDWHGDVNIFVMYPTVWRIIIGINTAEETIRFTKVISNTLEGNNCRRLFLVNTTLQIIAPVTTHSLEPAVLSALREAVRIRDLVVVNLHRSGDGEIVYGVTHPVFANSDPDREVVGAVYLEQAVSEVLFPLLTLQPTSSPTAETFLARRDANDILFISPLRLKPEVAPLTFRLPIDLPVTQQPLAYRALVNGEFGLCTGKDYRGVEVVGATYPVPDTSWVIVTKIDRTEIEYPAKVVGLITLGVVLLLVGLVLAIFRIFWQRLTLQHIAKFYSLFDSIADVILIVGVNGRFIHVNQSACQQLGYSREELLHMGPTNIDTPEYAAMVPERLKVVQENQTLIFESAHMRKDGSIIPVEMNLQRVIYDGQPAVMGLARDITERKRIESALQESRERLMMIFTETSNGLVVADTDGRIVMTNRALEDLFGYTANELLGQPVEIFLPEEAFFAAEDSQRTKCMEYAQHRNGHKIPIELSLKRFNSEEGKFILAVVVDMTERMKHQIVLERSRENWRNLAEAMPHIVWSCTPDGNHDYISSQWTKYTGVSTVENLDTQWLNHIHPEDREKSAAAWHHSVRTGENFDLEHRMRRHDGVYRWFKVRGTPVYNQEAEIIQWVGCNIDIEEVKQSEQTAQQANLAKSRFLATMSHEIRTPMNGILGMAQMLLMPDLKDYEQQDYARTILHSGQLLLTLLNDILDLSKVEAGKVVLESMPLNPEQILSEVIALFAEGARTKGLTFDTVWTGPSGEHYLGDPHRLRQMLSNLVNNAIKFTTQGQINIQAHEIARDGQSAILEFSVADTGIGIPKESQNLLFQPFSQADSSTTRRFSGTGLGLSIVHGLAHLMGGAVGCESEPGQGARFWFRLRALVASADSLLTKGIPAQDLTILATQFSAQVLVVEDNLINFKVIAEMLKKVGITVALASDGQQAVDHIRNGNPVDLIFMDVHMPVMDGCTAVECIRYWEMKTGMLRHPIIALTASVFNEDRQHCLNIGMDDFLAKPVKIDDLNMILNRWLILKSISSMKTSQLTAINAVDLSKVMAIIRELIPLLEEKRFDAINNFNALQEIIVGTELAEEFAKMRGLMNACNFEQALVSLRNIMVAQGLQE